MSAARTSPETLQALTAGLFRNRRPRTGQKVHRCSYHEGERETRPWLQHNTFEKSEHNARMRAAEEYDRATRAPGKRNGALGHIALEVYRLLLRLRGRKTGRLDPTYAWIAGQLCRSRSAVFRAMKRLKQFGFLDWLRRTRPVEDPEPDGQYVEQISNAYFLELRGAAAELVGRMLRRPSAKLRQVLDERRRDAKLAEADSADLVAGVSDPALRRSLERMLEKVEGANPPRPINGPCEV
jgi:hypothetical protein